MQNPPKRLLYLLTMWQEQPASLEHPAVWRFSLEDTRSRQRRGFGTLETMVAFLRGQMEAAPRTQSQGAETAGSSPSHSD